MKEIASIRPAATENCTGRCQGCGKTHIRIFGRHDEASRRLTDHVNKALSQCGIEGKILEVSDPVAMQANGISALPALMIEGEIVSQGIVPEVEAIGFLLQSPPLFRSKLYRLRNLVVPVDMSEVSANALVFAWKIAQEIGCDIEVVHAMDSLFEGNSPSSPGFLSGYNKTMHTELDAFIRETMLPLGIDYIPPAMRAGTPQNGEVRRDKPNIASKLIYGAPDLALVEYSRLADLIVMGATGRGGLGKNLFGSVSSEVSAHAHCPVLFVPKDAEYRGFQHILYASDADSLHGLSILQATSFAERFDGQVHSVHVGPGGERGTELQRVKFEASFEKAATVKPFIFSKMVSDDIVSSLYEYAFYHRIRLLIFVTHKRSFWDGILHKSVSNEALSSSDLPLLVVHSDSDMV